MVPNIKNIILKAFLFIMAIQILNLGIDAIEFQPLQKEEVIEDFNYINSMSEYVSEILMSYKDAFPEYQKNSASSRSQLLKHFSFKFFDYPSNFLLLKEFKESTAYCLVNKENYKYLFFEEINPPPPRAVFKLV